MKRLSQIQTETLQHRRSNQTPKYIQKEMDFNFFR